MRRRAKGRGLPLDRRHWLVGAHGVSGDAWARRWELRPFSAPCGTCGALAHTTLPWACGDVRGLVAPRCACGNDRMPFCLVRLDGGL